MKSNDFQRKNVKLSIQITKKIDFYTTAREKKISECDKIKPFIVHDSRQFRNVSKQTHLLIFVRNCGTSRPHEIFKVRKYKI